MVILVKTKDFVLEVDGERIPAGGFVKKIFKSTILGMISSLRGVKEPHEVVIRIRYD